MDYQITTHHVALPGFLKAAFPELFRRLSLLGVRPAGPPFVIYHQFGTEGIDAEVSVPTAGPVTATGKIKSRVLPAMTVARTLHVGPYEKLGEAYAAVSAWIKRNGFEAAGPIQERYLDGPGDRVASTEYRTEIEMPIVPSVVVAPV